MLLTTTPLALLMALGILYLGPVRGLWILFCSMPLGGAAAVILPGIGAVSMTDLCVVAMWCAAFLRGVGPGSIVQAVMPGKPGFPLLLLLVVTSVSAIYLPRVFQGQTEIFTTGQGRDQARVVLAQLRPVGANISQLAKMILAASAFVLFTIILRRTAGAQHALRAMVISTLFHIVLSAVDLVSGAMGLSVLEPLRTAPYMMLDNQRMMGIRRLVGGFPEPSSYGLYTIGLFGFWLRLWFGPGRFRFSGLILIVVILLCLRSTSSSTIATLAGYTVLFLAWQMRTVAKQNRSGFVYAFLSGAIPLVVGISVVLWAFVPAASEFLNSTLIEKMNTHSGQERTSWNVQALRNFYDSYGLGVGIGSVRASSWLLTVLGSIGLLGALMYFWFIIGAMTLRGPGNGSRSRTDEVAAALQSGALAILLQSMLSKPFPNLGTQFFAMLGVAVGVLLREKILENRARVHDLGSWKPRGYQGRYTS